MQEVTYHLKLGVTLIVLSSVLVTLFCMWGIARAATNDYYDEEVSLLDTNPDISWLKDKAISIVQLCNCVQDCYLDKTMQQIIVYKTARNAKGVVTATNSVVATYTDYNTFIDNYGGKVGKIHNITSSGTNAYKLFVHIGG